MNTRLLMQLSFFGLVMAFATISLIPEKAEPVFWLAIFAFCAFTLARVGTGRYFWHGFLLSIINSLWLTVVHLLFFETYIAYHPNVAGMTENIERFTNHPRVFMLITGLPFGVVFGLIQGIFALIASKIVKPLDRLSFKKELE